MPLLCPMIPRPVLLVVNDQATPLSARLAPLLSGAEVVECPSMAAAWSALASGRRYSAVVIAEADPDLERAAARGATPCIIHGPTPSAADLIRARATLTPVPRAVWALDDGPTPDDRPTGAGSGHLRRRRDNPRSTHGAGAGRCRTSGPDARLVVVCGPGGTGASTVAAALAGIGLAESVVLADFALCADQAFLHGFSDPGCGLLDLVAIGRLRPVTAGDVARHCVPLAGCRLLPGLARPSHWTAVSPPAFDAVLGGLLEACALVVADVTGEVEGEAESGSVDLEERNHMARRSVEAADVVVAVGRPGPQGDRRLAALVDDLLDHGVEPGRIQPAVNHVEPSSPSSWTPRHLCGLPSLPVGLPTLPTGLPACQPEHTTLVESLAPAVAGLIDRLPPAERLSRPVPVVPGTLGCVAR